MYTKAFWRAAGERALKTFAQTLLSAPAGIAIVGLIAQAVNGDWDLLLLQKLGLLVLSSVVSAVLAAGLSILTSVVNAREDGNPSAGNQEVLNTSLTPVP